MLQTPSKTTQTLLSPRIPRDNEHERYDPELEEELKKIAKYLAGLPGYEECPRYERATKTPRAMLDKFKTYQAKQ